MGRWLLLSFDFADGSSPIGWVAVISGLLQAGIFLLLYRRYQELCPRDLHAQSRAHLILCKCYRIETLKASGVEIAREQWSICLWIN